MQKVVLVSVFALLFAFKFNAVFAARNIEFLPLQIQQLDSLELKVLGISTNKEPLEKIISIEKYLGIQNPKNVLPDRLTIIESVSKYKNIQPSENSEKGLLDGILKKYRPDLYKYLKTFRQTERDTDFEDTELY